MTKETLHIESSLGGTKERHLAPAYFLSLEIENVRSFGPKQSLDLSNGKGRPARWTIILGDNGTGKTTILQSLISLVPDEIPLLSEFNRKPGKESQNTSNEKATFYPLFFAPEIMGARWNYQRSSTLSG